MGQTVLRYSRTPTRDRRRSLVRTHLSRQLDKYLLAIPMMTQTAEEVALNFMRHIVLQYGIPCSVVTD